MDKEKNQVKDWNIMMGNLFIKGIFSKEKEVEEVFSKSLLRKEYRYILDNFQMELNTEKENNLMMMELGMKVNGKKEKSMVSGN